MKKPRRKRDYEGLTVKSHYGFKNRIGGLPEGTLFRVNSAGASGLSLTSDKCAHCGMELYISRVQYGSVEILDTEKNRDTLAFNDKKKYR